MQPQRVLFGFPILALAAFYFLWGIIWRADGFVPLNASIASRRLADGTPLKTIYTGLAPLDGFLTTKAAFNYQATSGNDLAAWLLMIDLTITVQTATLWCLVDSLREGRSTIWLAFPALWALLWNAVGAAIILPLYTFLSLRNHPHKHFLPLSQAKSLSVSIFLGSFLPAFGRLSAPLIPRSPQHHQTLIALHEASPLAVSALQYLFSNIVFRVTSSNTTTPARGTDQSYMPPLRQAYLLAGIISALSHLYVVSHTLSTPDLFTHVFIPPSPTAAVAMATGVAEGAVVFLQWDFIIIALSALLWSYCLIAPEFAEGGFSAASLGVCLTMAGLIFGPGALVTGCLWWREGRMGSGKGKEE